MTDELQYSDDQSLQRAGRNLRGAEAAAAEVQRLYAQAEAAKAAFNTKFGRISHQFENELPAGARLKAEVEATARQAQAASTADDWRAVAANTASLPAIYTQEHDTDEARLDGSERGGRHKERRADVSYAEQDN